MQYNVPSSISQYKTDFKRTGNYKCAHFLIKSIHMYALLHAFRGKNLGQFHLPGILQGAVWYLKIQHFMRNGPSSSCSQCTRVSAGGPQHRPKLCQSGHSGPAAGGQCGLWVSTDESTAGAMTIGLRRALRGQAGGSQCWVAVTFLLFRFELFLKHGPEWIRSGAVEAGLRGRELRKENNRP